MGLEVSTAYLPWLTYASNDTIPLVKIILLVSWRNILGSLLLSDHWTYKWMSGHLYFNIILTLARFFCLFDCSDISLSSLRSCCCYLGKSWWRQVTERRTEDEYSISIHQQIDQSSDLSNWAFNWNATNGVVHENQQLHARSSYEIWAQREIRGWKWKELGNSACHWLQEWNQQDPNDTRPADGWKDRQTTDVIGSWYPCC